MSTNVNDPSLIGTAHELLAAAWLIKQGYDVCKNLGATGAMDMVAIHRITEEIIFIDVKTVAGRDSANQDGSITRSYRSSYRPRKELKTLIIRPLFVFYDGTVSWKAWKLPEQTKKPDIVITPISVTDFDIVKPIMKANSND